MVLVVGLAGSLPGRFCGCFARRVWGGPTLGAFFLFLGDWLTELVVCGILFLESIFSVS